MEANGLELSFSNTLTTWDRSPSPHSLIINLHLGSYFGQWNDLDFDLRNTLGNSNTPKKLVQPSMIMNFPPQVIVTKSGVPVWSANTAGYVDHIRSHVNYLICAITFPSVKQGVGMINWGLYAFTSGIHIRIHCKPYHLYHKHTLQTQPNMTAMSRNYLTARSTESLISISARSGGVSERVQLPIDT